MVKNRWLVYYHPPNKETLRKLKAKKQVGPTALVARLIKEMIRATQIEMSRAQRPTIDGERTQLLSEALQREALIDASVKRTFGFVPQVNITPFQNAVKLYESHPPNHPFLPTPSNMSFHDLTDDQSAPPYAKCLLGLGAKFVPSTPTRTTGSLSESFSRLTRDLKLRVYFACEDSDLEKSKWSPEDQYIPRWVDGRLDRFYTELSKLFKIQNSY